MSDEQPPPGTPPPETPATAPVGSGATASPEAASSPPTPDPKPEIPNPKPQTPSAGSRPPIDYVLPSQGKSWLPAPAMVRNIGCLMKLIVGFTILICLGYLALVALNPKARQWALQGSRPGPGGAPPTGKGPTPFKFINQVLAIPAQAMGKTDDVVKANNARVGQLDGVIAEEEGRKSRGGRPVADPFANSGAAPAPKDAARAAGAAEASGETGPQAVSGAAMLALAEKLGATTPSSEHPAPGTQLPTPRPQAPDPGPQTPDQMKLAGDIAISHASPAGAPRAGAAFFYSVVKLNVSGVTQGKPARALINNRLAYEGDEINPQLGIVFAKVDAAQKLLVFRDSSGATVTRSY